MIKYQSVPTKAFLFQKKKIYKKRKKNQQLYFQMSTYFVLFIYKLFVIMLSHDVSHDKCHMILANIIFNMNYSCQGFFCIIVCFA
ncbi:hypothetical protein KUTeg_008163 [Tegillarca granosa]|uniref:Transmembrane protein n=1 Tax=Tegillarca granosa TaxID=220873 RepID=A0ABQ9FCM2_TEGGR|nr:hypothetical protein KUTeg_008163 [Tegillarca granosa]